jgi:hypothetical protein
MNVNLKDSTMPTDGDSDPQTSETVNDNPADDPAKALLESNRPFQRELLNHNSHKQRVLQGRST